MAIEFTQFFGGYVSRFSPYEGIISQSNDALIKQKSIHIPPKNRVDYIATWVFFKYI